MKSKHRKHRKLSKISVDRRLWKLLLLELANALTLTLLFYLFFFALTLALQKLLIFSQGMNDSNLETKYWSLLDTASQQYGSIVSQAITNVIIVLAVSAVVISLVYAVFNFLIWPAAFKRKKSWKLFRNHLFINGSIGLLFFLTSYATMAAVAYHRISETASAYIIISAVMAVFILQYLLAPIIDVKLKPINTIKGKYVLAVFLMALVSLLLSLIVLFLLSFISSINPYLFLILLACLLFAIIAWGKAFAADWSK